MNKNRLAILRDEYYENHEQTDLISAKNVEKPNSKQYIKSTVTPYRKKGTTVLAFYVEKAFLNVIFAFFCLLFLRFCAIIKLLIYTI